MGTQLSNIHSYSDFLQEYQPQIRTASLLGVTLNETAEAYQSLVSYQGLVQQGPVTGSFLSEVPEITSLGVPEVCEILGLSKSAYYRAVKFDVLPEAIVEKLTSLFKIYDRGIIVFNGLKEDFFRWLRTPILSVGGHQPVAFFKNETGRMVVHDMLDRIDHGVYG